MITFITISLLLLIGISLTFVVLNKFTKDVNNEAKKYFTQKGQEYIDELKKEEKEENKEKSQSNTDDEKNNTFVCVEDNNKYEIDDLFEIMKSIDRKFNLDYETIIELFSKQDIPKKDLEKYDRLKKIKEYIDNIGVYNIITSEDEDFLKEVVINLRKMDIDIFNAFQGTRKKFKIQEFTNYLENEIQKYDPNVYVLVGSKRINYDYIGLNVKTIYNKKIYKGIKIIYRNCMYDYSLS